MQNQRLAPYAQSKASDSGSGNFFRKRLLKKCVQFVLYKGLSSNYTIKEAIGFCAYQEY